MKHTPSVSQPLSNNWRDYDWYKSLRIQYAFYIYPLLTSLYFTNYFYKEKYPGHSSVINIYPNSSQMTLTYFNNDAPLRKSCSPTFALGAQFKWEKVIFMLKQSTTYKQH